MILLIISLLLIETQAKNLCSQNHTNWIQHKPHQSNFVKDWIKSLSLSRNKPQTKGIEILWQKYKKNQENIVEIITKIDDKTGKYMGKGWKIAYHYQHQEPYHAGYLYGTIDENNKISGSDVTFVYPDFETILFGEFDNGAMITALEGKITAYKCVHGVLDLKIKIKTDSQIHNFDPPTTIRISSNVSTDWKTFEG